METTRLDRELIERPEQWRLALQSGPRGLEVVAHSPMEDNSLLWRRIAPSGDESDRRELRALEEAVYDNPLLLADFGRVQCLIDTPFVVIAPADAAALDDADRDTLMRAANPDFEGVTFVNTLPASNASIVAGIDRETLGFLRRTFFNVDIQHHLTPLCRYFLNLARRTNAPRLYANLRPGSLDVVATERDRLLMANTFAFATPDDAVYYILACRKLLDMEQAEMYLAGDAAVREQVAPILRRFIPAVMPVIFPSTMFRAGKDALGAPFELIILPLCE